MASSQSPSADALVSFIARARAALEAGADPATTDRLRQEANQAGDPEFGRALDYLLQAASRITPAVSPTAGAPGSSPTPALTAAPAPAAPSTATTAAQWGGMLSATVVLGYLFTNWDEISAVLDRVLAWFPTVTSFWGTQGVLAAAGALGGLLNGWSSYNGFALPQFRQVDGRSVFFPGVLGNVVAGAAAAVAAIGLALPAGASAAPADTTSAGVSADGQLLRSRLTSFSVLSAFAVGLGGANILSLRRDRGVFQGLAGQAVAAPANARAQNTIANAPTSVDALNRFWALVHGEAPPAPIGNLPSDPAQRLALIQPALRKLVDPGRLADRLRRIAARGQPATVARDGSNLDPGVLILTHPPGPALATALQNLRINVVAGNPLANLKAAVTAAGVDSTAEAGAIQDAWNASRSFIAWLAQAPADWQLTLAELGVPPGTTPRT